MPDILHRIGIKSSPEKVYAALTEQEGLARLVDEGDEGFAQRRGYLTVSVRRSRF